MRECGSTPLDHGCLKERRVTESFWTVSPNSIHALVLTHCFLSLFFCLPPHSHCLRIQCQRSWMCSNSTENTWTCSTAQCSCGSPGPSSVSHCRQTTFRRHCVTLPVYVSAPWMHPQTPVNQVEEQVVEPCDWGNNQLCKTMSKNRHYRNSPLIGWDLFPCFQSLILRTTYLHTGPQIVLITSTLGLR